MDGVGDNDVEFAQTCFHKCLSKLYSLEYAHMGTVDVSGHYNGHTVDIRNMVVLPQWTLDIIGKNNLHDLSDRSDVHYGKTTIFPMSTVCPL